jgi:cell division protein FtsI/penicillin-binding protein 2
MLWMLKTTLISGILLACFGFSAIAAFADNGLESAPNSPPARQLDAKPTPHKTPTLAESEAEPIVAAANPLAGIDLTKMRGDTTRYTTDLPDGRHVVFTVNPQLQQYADRLFKQYEIPAGAAVIINSRTGRILAFTQQRRQSKYANTPSVALDPSPPAASLFKIVTAAALFEKSNISSTTNSCYSGGGSRLEMQHLKDPPTDNRACVSLTTALGRSINAIFAKLSDRNLNRATLQHYATRFGFNRNLPFDVPLEQSRAEIPSDRLERARTAAGFWHTHVSPLHAALIVQSLAQNGAMLRPYIVDTVEDGTGNQIYRSKPKYLGHTVKKETASALIKAMTHTIKLGTARKAFYNKRGVPFLPGIQVSGKTGTLTGNRPYRAYNWFAGVAPADKPEVAISVLVVNEPRWRIKASAIAARLLKRYFELSKNKG